MKKILLSIIFVLVFFSTNSYANDEVVFSGETKTIKELKKDLKNMEIKEKVISTKLDDFIKDSKLKIYIRSDLTKKEFDDFSFIVSRYLRQKNKLEKKLKKAKNNLEKIKKIKQELLDIKLALYKKMTSYVKPSKYKLYLEYIKSDKEIVSKKNKIETKKLETKDLMDKKVEILEEKIKKYKKTLENDLTKLIEKKLEEKIKNLEKKEDFVKLSNRNKIRLLTKTIERAKAKIESLKKELKEKKESYIFKDSYERKIEVYYISIEKIEIFKKKFEEIEKKRENNMF